jgi:hypothetical protein
MRRTFKYRIKSGLHGHPRATKPWGNVQVHILVAEAALGHHLPADAEVHHVDEDTYNNAPSNLVICQDRAYHKLLHQRALVVRAGGDPNTHKMCGRCQAPKAFGEFNRSTSNKSHGLYSLCRECQRAGFAKWYANQKTSVA